MSVGIIELSGTKMFSNVKFKSQPEQNSDILVLNWLFGDSMAPWRDCNSNKLREKQ